MATIAVVAALWRVASSGGTATVLADLSNAQSRQVAQPDPAAEAPRGGEGTVASLGASSPRTGGTAAIEGDDLRSRARAEWARGDVSAALNSAARAQQVDSKAIEANDQLLSDFVRDARVRASVTARAAAEKSREDTPAYRTGEQRQRSAEQMARSNQLAQAARAYLDAAERFTNAVRTPQPAPVRVGGPIKPPKQLKRVDPEYPSMARSARLEGIVILETTIGADGKVADVRVLRSIPLLDTAAMDAVRQWAYEPTFVNGVAVPVIMTVTVRFALTPAAPVRVGGQVKPPTKLKNVNPAYPQEAQAAHVQGVVILEATIDVNGKVADVRVLRSIPALDQAAMDAVRQWEYTPSLLNNVAVPVIMTVTVSFTLTAPAAPPAAN
jgi:protein TonB